jgi:anthranilate synthase component 1
MPPLRCTIREIPADLETPVSAFLKLKASGARYLLESVEQADRIGRYSFIGVGSATTFKVLKDYVMTERGGKVDIQPIQGRDPLAILRGFLADFRLERPSVPLPSLIGGAVGYVGYDYVRFVEKLPELKPDPLEIPLCSFLIVNTFVIFDHFTRRIMVAALGAGDETAEADRILKLLDQPLRPEAIHPAPVDVPPEFRSTFSREGFCQAVERAKEYIRAGDIFQVVLSQRVEGEIAVDPFQVYRALRMLNPSPYMFYIDFGDYRLIGSSPETHVKLEGRRALERPIAGTRPRGGTPEADAALERELMADEKERAEHLMLVDLARNDLGRVCRPGSVQVGRFYSVERYSHVMHIVSEATGELSEGRDQFELLSNTFPAGTLSGAPKIRAMEIIEELEPVRRSFYGGTTGYFSLTGDMDMAITIRSMIVKGRTAVLQAGAGIVYDSVPEREWEETVDKMKALRVAIDLAGAGLRLTK